MPKDCDAALSLSVVMPVAGMNAPKLFRRLIISTAL
jgi:hypothetical protein